MMKLKELIKLDTDEDKINFYNLLDSFGSLTDLYKFYGVSDNSVNHKFICECAKVVGFDLSLYKTRRHKDIYCLNCGKLITGSGKKFCSSNCAATYNNLLRGGHSNETKEKIRNTIISKYGVDKHTKNMMTQSHKSSIEHICVVCGNTFHSKRKDAKVCSKECKCKLQSIQSEEKHIKKYQEYLNNPENFFTGVHSYKTFKRDILREQDYRCAICGCEMVWNNKPIVFIIDHIDGDALNHRRENLRCICPNCDSQLDTYKSKNKNSTRRNFWKEKIIKDTIESLNNCSVAQRQST